MSLPLFLIAIILTACTSEVTKVPPDYQTINEVWTNEGAIDQLKEKFGSPDLASGNVVQYMFTNSKVPKMHFQFNAECTCPFA